MEILKTAEAVACWRATCADQIGLVPTMGNLHNGHLALVAAAGNHCPRVIASIFVNPLQFGPGEDLDTYPRTFEADCEALDHAGVDAVFAPAVEQMYPGGQASATRVQVRGLTDVLCGLRRPGHFEGVATVVAKLFNLVRPNAAFFGEKDFQQLSVIRRMVADLCMGVDVVGVATVREADGLASSSRNQYLDADQRKCAPSMAAALKECTVRLVEGERDLPALEARGWSRLADAGFEPDYFEIRDPWLAPAEVNGRSFRVLAAGYLGTTRLIDNMGISVA